MSILRACDLPLTCPYEDYLPPLSTAEFDALRADVLSNGVEEAVIATEDHRVLDGHNRLKIDPQAPVRIIKGSTGWSDEECMAFVSRTNRRRRNLSPDQKREQDRKDRDVARRLRESDPRRYTEEVLGQMFGVARRTVSDWLTTIGGTANGCTPDARVKIPPPHRRVIFDRAESGEPQGQIASDYGVTQQAVSRIVGRERSAIDKQRQLAERLAALKGETFGVVLGDFREAGATVPTDSVQLIVTDPPYDAEAVQLYTDLAAFASRVLVSGGLCFAYCGHSFLPQIYSGMSMHLEYVWTFGILHTGGDLRFRKWHLHNGWKPVVCFGKPPLDCWWNWTKDIVSGGREKEDHAWQQAVSEAAHFVQGFSCTEGLVCDPFCGSGTVAVACVQLGRPFVAFEVDQEAADKARVRIASVQKESHDN